MPCATSLEDQEITHFFQVELGMPKPTVARLAEEGIERPEDLMEFTSKTLIP